MLATLNRFLMPPLLSIEVRYARYARSRYDTRATLNLGYDALPIVHLCLMRTQRWIEVQGGPTIFTPSRFIAMEQEGVNIVTHPVWYARYAWLSYDMLAMLDRAMICKLRLIDEWYDHYASWSYDTLAALDQCMIRSLRLIEVWYSCYDPSMIAPTMLDRGMIC